MGNYQYNLLMQSVASVIIALFSSGTVIKTESECVVRIEYNGRAPLEEAASKLQLMANDYNHPVSIISQPPALVFQSSDPQVLHQFWLDMFQEVKAEEFLQSLPRHGIGLN